MDLPMDSTENTEVAGKKKTRKLTDATVAKRLRESVEKTNALLQEARNRDMQVEVEFAEDGQGRPFLTINQIIASL